MIIRNGELLCGVIDKNQVGATSSGLIHACYEVRDLLLPLYQIYGGRMASEILSAMGRLFTAHLKFSSISFGIDDLLLTPAADKALVIFYRC